MRFFFAFIGLLLVASLCDAAVVQNRKYRNTEEILVPVVIIQDGEEIKEPAVDLKEKELVLPVRNLETEMIAEDISSMVDEIQKSETVEAVVEAQRRIDEAIVQEGIKEAVKKEQDEEIIQTVEKEKKLESSILENSEKVDAIQPENNEKRVAEVVKEFDEALDSKIKKQHPVLVIEEANNESNDNTEQPEGAVRQASTEATPTQTTQQNFVQQLIQNSPLGQFFNQITGQAPAQAANDETVPAPAPTIPGLFNPVTAVQNAAQSVVNSTTQAFQGLQQFASNLGNQFQSTLSGLGGQQQEQGANDATTARPLGPIQQLVSNFIGSNQQPAPTQQRPFQGLLNIFQGNTRPQSTVAVTNANTQEPEIIQEQNIIEYAEPVENIPDQQSSEANDSFEESVQPEAIIEVNDNDSGTETYNEQEVQNYSK